MNDAIFLRAAQNIGFKTPLANHDTFVGRRREISKLKASMEGSQVTSMWIWGPRRIGKSSLACRIPNNDRIKSIRLSCDTFEWTNIGDLSEIIAREAFKQQKIKTGGLGNERLRTLAGKSNVGKRIFIVLDEFDNIAINLEQREQAYLRSILQENPFFGLIFISRIAPDELLEDYSVESSRLLGVCEIIRLSMLGIKEIIELTDIVGNMVGERLPVWMGQWIYERVGGYPVCNQSLLKELMLLSQEKGGYPSMEEISGKEHFIYETVRMDLAKLWDDLPINIKKVIVANTGDLDTKTKRELNILNFMREEEIVRPIWLIEAGKDTEKKGENKNTPELIGAAEELINVVSMCNDLSLRRGSHQVFQITQQIYRIFDIARQVKDETDLNARVNLLYKICIEGIKSTKLPKDDRCLIPANIRPVYTKSEGFETLVAWRNFCDHDPSMDLMPWEKSKRYCNIGELCCKYLGPGKVKPSNEKEFKKIYQGILTDVIKSVKLLKEALQAGTIDGVEAK